MHYTLLDPRNTVGSPSQVNHAVDSPLAVGDNEEIQRQNVAKMWQIR